MKKHNFINRIMFVLLVHGFISSCGNEKSGTQLGFDISGKSLLTFYNDTDDSVHVNLIHWYTIPQRPQEFDSLIAPRSSVDFKLITQNPTYVSLTVDGIKYKVFTVPDDNGSVTASEDAGSIVLAFSGDLQPINEFLVKKMVHFNSPDTEWMFRANATSTATNLEELVSINDSVTQVHLKYLDQNLDIVPVWFADFERQRLTYLNAQFKLNSLFYRREMLDIQDSVPQNFLENTVDSLRFSNEPMLGVTEYMRFLGDYLAFGLTSTNNIRSATSREELKAYFNRRISAINTALPSEIRDVYLTYYLSGIIDRRRYAFDEEWIEMVQDENYQTFLGEELNANPILPVGSALPYFNLPDTSNNFIESHHYKGQILLINFWATWCKPCIEEFPYENELVDRFVGKPVKLLNIAIQTKEDSWRRMINKHGLKSDNLLAQGNWEEKLSQDFDITAFPHSVLVDWEGKIVQNKCPRASENVDELIAELLVEMEERK